MQLISRSEIQVREGPYESCLPVSPVSRKETTNYSTHHRELFHDWSCSVCAEPIDQQKRYVTTQRWSVPACRAHDIDQIRTGQLHILQHQARPCCRACGVLKLNICGCGPSLINSTSPGKILHAHASYNSEVKNLSA